MADVFNLPTKEQFDTMNSHLANISIPDAAKVTIEDTGSHYTSGNVEGALQEVGEQINSLAAHDFCRTSKSTNQSLANTSFATIAFTSATEDTNNMFNVVDNTKITIKKAGKYLIIGTIYYAANASGYRISEIAKNGGAINDAMIDAASSGNTSVVCSTIISCGVNDYIQLYGRQNSGGALDVVPGTKLEVIKVG